MARSDAPHRYAIRGGIEGKKRLNLLARVMLPTTIQLLDRVGLIRGMKCRDVGCGGGHVAILMAGIVGPEGRVIGTDTDEEILALAREDAQGAKVTNVEFQRRDVRRTPNVPRPNRIRQSPASVPATMLCLVRRWMFGVERSTFSLPSRTTPTSQPVH